LRRQYLIQAETSHLRRTLRGQGGFIIPRTGLFTTVRISSQDGDLICSYHDCCKLFDSQIIHVSQNWIWVFPATPQSGWFSWALAIGLCSISSVTLQQNGMQQKGGLNKSIRDELPVIIFNEKLRTAIADNQWAFQCFLAKLCSAHSHIHYSCYLYNQPVASSLKSICHVQVCSVLGRLPKEWSITAAAGMQSHLS
jgi:hypothetical protein